MGRVGDVQAVGDEADEIRLAIDRAFEQSDVVLTTGGLAHQDDITKGGDAGLFRGELREDPAVRQCDGRGGPPRV